MVLPNTANNVIDPKTVYTKKQKGLFYLSTFWGTDHFLASFVNVDVAHPCIGELTLQDDRQRFILDVDSNVILSKERNSMQYLSIRQR
jgi:hypothetical protein